MGEKNLISLKETEEKKQEECFHLEDLKCRSKNLGRALMHKQALKNRKCKYKREKSQGRMADAIGLSSEFLASIIVGIVFGLGFDELVGSYPWGLVFFLFLGFAAGVLSILRSVGYVPFSQLGKNGVLRQDKQNQRGQ
ncbi:ATP synthase protein I [Bartonella fuyuanensis]|uniref:ATP synthase protein I n=1 Tax=Bartonella fuyuanensis TaxID=1460968 RepID=A0A840DV46_9HYPH|nr:ATP synthase protein I [Bartonella fuyuanensis]